MATGQRGLFLVSPARVLCAHLLHIGARIGTYMQQCSAVSQSFRQAHVRADTRYRSAVSERRCTQCSRQRNLDDLAFVHGRARERDNKFPKFTLNFTMQKEDSPSHQNTSTYMEY
jgi:hypothetical protein